MLEINKIYFGDCLGFMKEIPDKSIDLILTDPPYGDYHKGKYGGDSPFGGVKKPGSRIAKRNFGAVTWDQIPSKEYFDEMFRISKNQVIFGGNFFIDKIFPTSCWIVWDKDNSGDFADCELIWTSFDTAIRKMKYRWNGLLQEDMAHKEIRYHPTQKPVKLITKILQEYSKPGDLICDPFLGSGTTAIACIKAGRNFIGMEKDKGYFEIAQERIRKARNRSLSDFVWQDDQVKMKGFTS